MQCFLKSTDSVLLNNVTNLHQLTLHITTSRPTIGRSYSVTREYCDVTTPIVYREAQKSGYWPP